MSALNIVHRPVHDANPGAWPSGKKYTYSHTTSTTSLRPHIERNHLDYYLSIYKEKGWAIQLPGLVSQARSQSAKEASASQVRRSGEFSQQKFHEHLLKFIVADDQVCDICVFFSCSLRLCFLVPNHKSLNVVECPEFRQLLLLLRSDLKDTDIPRRTKQRELLLQAWKEYFQVLRSNLAACLPPSFRISSHFFLSRPLWARSPLRWICGLINFADLI